MLKRRCSLGKYRIEKRIAQGGFADVYRACDTIEGIKVALKIPNLRTLEKEDLERFRREVQLVAKLDHPHILSIKNASFIGDLLVIAYPLGLGSLADRLTKRLSLKKALNYSKQMLEALAYAHSSRVIHCDVKPENLILFRGDRLRLADFGLARISRENLTGSGSGTVGYLAPEQAMGKPSASSDVFSAGLVIYRMLTGILPEWPYHWPPPNYALLRRKVHPDLVSFLRRALEVEIHLRFTDARQMLKRFDQIEKNGTRARYARNNHRGKTTWREHRVREFRRRYGKFLGTQHSCRKCEQPLSEMMKGCPWCGYSTKVYRGPTAFALRCKRCGHGMKKEWTYCTVCYGGAQGPFSDRLYADRRYAATCFACKRPLMAFTRYCPWCRRKTRRGWNIGGSKERCSSCNWGVLREFWKFCPWCTRSLSR